MLSFKDVNGDNIPFENKNQLSLEEQRDVLSNEITAYLVNYNDHIFEVDETTYVALSNL